jgi:hypothetical protein
VTAPLVDYTVFGFFVIPNNMLATVQKSLLVLQVVNHDVHLWCGSIGNHSCAQTKGTCAMYIICRFGRQTRVHVPCRLAEVEGMLTLRIEQQVLCIQACLQESSHLNEFQNIDRETLTSQKHMLNKISKAFSRHLPKRHAYSYNLGLNLILSCLGLGFISELV